MLSNGWRRKICCADSLKIRCAVQTWRTHCRKGRPPACSGVLLLNRWLSIHDLLPNRPGGWRFESSQVYRGPPVDSLQVKPFDSESQNERLAVMPGAL